jgi:hypothetical protein
LAALATVAGGVGVFAEKFYGGLKPARELQPAAFHVAHKTGMAPEARGQFFFAADDLAHKNGWDTNFTN